MKNYQISLKDVPQKEIFKNMELSKSVRVLSNNQIFLSNISPGYKVNNNFVEIWGIWGTAIFSIQSVINAIKNNNFLKV